MYYIGPTGGSGTEATNFNDNVTSLGAAAYPGWTANDTADFSGYAPYSQNLDPLRLNPTTYMYLPTLWDRHFDVAALGTSAYTAGILTTGYSGAIQAGDLVIDAAHTNATSVNVDWWALVNNVTFNAATDFTVNGSTGIDGFFVAGNVTVLNNHNYAIVCYDPKLTQYGVTVGWANDPFCFASPTFTVAQGGTLTLTDNGWDGFGNVTFAGLGTTNLVYAGVDSQWNTTPTADKWHFTQGSQMTITASRPGTQDWDAYLCAAVTGTGGTATLTNGEFRFEAPTFTGSAVQMTLTTTATNTATIRFVQANDNYAAPTANAPTVTGVKLTLQGQSAKLVMGNWSSDGSATVLGTNQTFVGSTFGGDGQFNTGGNTITLQGSTLALSKTSVGNGQFLVTGNIQFAKSATGGSSAMPANSFAPAAGVIPAADSVLSAAITATSGLPNLKVTGTVTSASSTTNNLADVDLVVNITPGLSAGVNSTNLGVIGTDPFAASEPLMVVGASGLANSTFGKVTFVGGSATLTYTATGVQLTNIFSNPTLAGDINNDGLVDVADYDIWAANVGLTGATWLQGDLNGDGLVDVADYDIWAANVGATSATPEPISMIILAIGGGLVALKRRNA
jgi:hypothetical protein